MKGYQPNRLDDLLAVAITQKSGSTSTTVPLYPWYEVLFEVY
jgi:hypothetical protein